jgi:hypothetical protein
VGKIRQTAEDYVDHDLQVQKGSSGASLLDHNWNVIAINGGRSGLSRVPAEDTFEAVPIYALWDAIQRYPKGDVIR